MTRRHRAGICLLLTLGLAACQGRTPVLVTHQRVTTDYLVGHLELLGPVEGRSMRIRTFSLALGEPKSVLRAEREALAEQNADILVARVRYTGREGIVLPLGSIIAVLFPGFPRLDVPVLVREIWSVQGIAARYTGSGPKER